MGLHMSHSPSFTVPPLFHRPVYRLDMPFAGVLAQPLFFHGSCACAEVRCKMDGFGGRGQRGSERKGWEVLLVYTSWNLVILAVVRGAVHAGIRPGICVDCRAQHEGATICTAQCQRSNSHVRCEQHTRANTRAHASARARHSQVSPWSSPCLSPLNCLTAVADTDDATLR